MMKSKRDSFVGKKNESYKNVGSGTVGLWTDVKFSNAVRDDPLCGLQEPCGLGHVPPRVFEGVDNQFPFKIYDLAFKRP